VSFQNLSNRPTARGKVEGMVIFGDKNEQIETGAEECNSQGKTMVSMRSVPE